MESAGKMYSDDAEKSVLGCLLLEDTLCLQYVHKLNESDFYINDSRALFKAIKSCCDKNMPADLVTVSAVFSDSDRERLSIFAMGCASTVPTVKAFESYYNVLKEMSKRRKLKESLQRALLALEEGKAAGSISAEILTEITNEDEGKKCEGMREAVLEFYDDLGRRYSLGGELPGIATGFSRLDALLGGMQRGEMVVLGARPSVGKSAFAGGVFMNAVLDLNKPCMFFSYEMPRLQIIRRMMSSLAHVKNMDMRMGSLTDKDFQNIAVQVEKISAARCEIYDDCPDFNEVRYRASCSRARYGELGLIIIDYLQLMPGRGKSLREVVEYNSRMLKRLAKELDCAVLVLSQLSRKAEDATVAPQLSDLRETGAIEQDADVVLFLYRDGEHRRIKVAKARDGDLGETPLLFLKDYVMFCEPMEKKSEEGVKENGQMKATVPINNDFKEVQGEEISFPDL